MGCSGCAKVAPEMESQLAQPEGWWSQAMGQSVPAVPAANGNFLITRIGACNKKIQKVAGTPGTGGQGASVGVARRCAR